MKKFLSELKCIATVDNSHEEDNEAFERYEMPVSDRRAAIATTLVIAAMLLIMCIR